MSGKNRRWAGKSGFTGLKMGILEVFEGQNLSITKVFVDGAFCDFCPTSHAQMAFKKQISQNF
jgi:hypothetical protein